MSLDKQVKVLFVCMGNICRSPTAEGVFQKLVNDQGLDKQIKVDSAGTHSYHIGSKPDARAQAAALKREVNLSKLRGRKFTANDFSEFDYVMVMDQANYDNAVYLREGEEGAQLNLFMDFAANASVSEVPDPYYGGVNGFEYVLDLIEEASQGLLKHIQQNDLKQ